MKKDDAAKLAAARRRANTEGDDMRDIIAEAFGVASAWAGAIFVVSFGAMMLVAAWMGW